ncbi:C40 family peptidase [Paenibacillus chartarius]|uniref:C40 family peptidase n=1 Tax=Paenibacillus chartarius TaxID=747481 RepID=A0ABV6DGX4_9BACL
MMKRTLRRTIVMTTALTIALTGAAGTSAFASTYDDMDAVSLAKQLVGKDYSKGDESPKDGFDASGLLQFVYSSLDYSMPRTLKDQFAMNKPTIKTVSSLQPGDAVFFGKGSSPSFAGVYIGSGKMVMASQSKDEVVTRNVADYKSQFMGAKRILSELDRKRADIVLTAIQYMGTPYEFGAKYGQTATFDCSTFTKTVYSKFGVTLPRVSRNQALEGKYVSKSNLETGDLVFFTTKASGDKVGHVGIYVGGGMMIHTYGEGGVKYSSINSDWWSDHYVTGRRVL